MTERVIGPDDFKDYFIGLHGQEPYPWQVELAKRAIEGQWPEAVDLPTGSGKTACIDIAIFALACQAWRESSEHAAPRRIFFCVNRRIIVDEAHDRAFGIAAKLREAEKKPGESSVLGRVARALREISGSDPKAAPPLDVIELRGGIYKDNRWARSMTQPTVICTTVDQLGSRLLFRGYGVSTLAAPVQAALIAYDSLVLLDEAHISSPFLETLNGVRRYLDPARWAERAVAARPMVVVPMTATPPGQTLNVLRLTDADRAIDPLARRLTASKPAILRKAKKDVSTEIMSIVEKEIAKDRPVAVCIMVNRVATARTIFDQLRSKDRMASLGLADGTLHLVIGSMRPIDRNSQSDALKKLVGPARPQTSSSMSIVVSTQCLEVGADYDFDVLITECASLDALRQRFGRLNRAGRAIDAKSFIVTQSKDLRPDDKLDDAKPLDPIYGNALSRTWDWLERHATDGKIDFGIDAFAALLARRGEEQGMPKALLSPAAQRSAPLMLPAYLDLWCQTAPRPALDPDVPLFLHGESRAEPDVQVCWRADLSSSHGSDKHWLDIVSMLPPTSAECMSVPISRVREWLGTSNAPTQDLGDVLGCGVADDARARSEAEPPTERARGVLWRGPEHSKRLTVPQDLRPGDTLVLPIDAERSQSLGHIPTRITAGPAAKQVGHDQASSDTKDAGNEAGLLAADDVAELAFRTAKRRAVIRLHPACKPCTDQRSGRWPAGLPEVDRLFAVATADVHDDTPSPQWKDLLAEAAKALSNDPQWEELASDLQHLHEQRDIRAQRYPDHRGWLLTSRKLLPADGVVVHPLDEGDDDQSVSRSNNTVSLGEHLEHVRDAAVDAVVRVKLADYREVIEIAALLHDLGKADPRFQAMLRGTTRTRGWLMHGPSIELVAKSARGGSTPSERRRFRELSGLPDGFRHEMLSVQAAEAHASLPAAHEHRDLVLHLVASHHGHARPFAPVVDDEELPAVDFGAGVRFSHEERAALPPHRLDSGIAERFWALTRRYGWWGLAYLESVLRLADQQASAEEEASDAVDEAFPVSLSGCGIITPHSHTDRPGLLLPGVDGTNPLGFLAALGLLRVLTHAPAKNSARMHWQRHAGTWCPLVSGVTLDETSLLDLLNERLVRDFDQHDASVIDGLATDDWEARTNTIRDQIVLASLANRDSADWIAASASDAVAAEAINQLQTTRRDYHIGNLRSVIARTDREHIRRSLFLPWDYADGLDNQSLHLDPSEDRRHAHQWNKPAGDPDRKQSGGMLGANRLAVEAFALFTSVPVGDSLRTLGFTGQRSTDTRWTWPIWVVPMALAQVQSALALDELQGHHISPEARRYLEQRGIAAAYRTHRILVGKTPNLTPALSVV